MNPEPSQSPPTLCASQTPGVVGEQPALTLTVVIPVHNAAECLRSCLADLARSTVPFRECIVVDDGSTDDSAEVARRFGVKVISTNRRQGPAHARNLGAREATGDILLFLDADVGAHPDTLARILSAFQSDPTLDALIGSYDDSPDCQDFISQYRNLMHSFVHQTARTKACTFWSGCGAIRQEVFLDHAGFNEEYRRPAIEDIELGYRLQHAGRKLILDKTVLVKHRKRWTFWGLVKTDILDRGIPWTELILRERCMPNDLNLEISQRVSVALAFLLMLLTMLAAIWWRGYFITPLMAILFFLLSRYWLGSTSQPASTRAMLVMGAIVASIVWLSWTHHMLGILPPLLLGYLLLMLVRCYPCSSGRQRRTMEMILGGYIVAAVVFMISRLPAHILIFSLFLISALIVILNSRFYGFLAARQGKLFALAAIPFHLLYHVYNGISFLAGLTHYVCRKLTARFAR